MDNKKLFSSNTLAGSGNQSFFISDGDREFHTGMLFYKLFAGGEYRYTLMFSDTVDSTFADGSHSRCNMLCGDWEIASVALSVCKDRFSAHEFVPVTFGGKSGKLVSKGEVFYSDPVMLRADKGDLLCVKICFRGAKIPYHEETLLPTFLCENGLWVSSNRMPFPSMIGCDRRVKGVIAFFGDSITQGIGTPSGSYLHWNALLADMLGEDYAYWNLGLGFGRASDAASGGAWLNKAASADIAVICFGVNDILQGASASEIKRDLAYTVRLLKEKGTRVIMQTVPPFDYSDEHKTVWNEINLYIKNELAKECEIVFDVVPVLSVGNDAPQNAKYGGHPNALGCRAWAEALYGAIKDRL